MHLSITVPLQYTIDPPVSVVIIVGLILGVLLTTIGGLTLGRSLQRHRQRRRIEAIRADLQPALLERLYDPEDPAWESWVESMSAREHAVLESLLDEYLRELDGSDAESLAGLGAALGIGRRARRQLKTGGTYERLAALTWLALLEEPPEPAMLRSYCTRTPRERAAAARVLYACGHRDVASLGVELMLRDAAGAFSIFGIDTLYRVAESDPSHLLERAATDYADWDPALQEQVLLVTRHLQTTAGGADLSWIVDLLSSSEVRTRIEAVRTLGGYGWRRSLRDQVDIQQLCSDPSPLVRASTYRMLSEWGDEAAVTQLRVAAASEENERAQITAAEALLPHQDRHGITIPESLSAAWDWAAEHNRFDTAARDISS